MPKMVYIALLATFLISCSSGKYKPKRNLTVVFYNVENLFDLVDDPHKNDNEFLPESEKQWTAERYEKKVIDISKVLGSINKNELPEIIGLCEVENKSVLEDLANSETLSPGKYQIVHFESPDFRGIDCALLFRPNEFKVLKSSPIRVKIDGNEDYTTRDILYVKGRTKNREELHVFVNHWPSRIGGLEKTEPKRKAVAAILKAKIDSIQNIDQKAKIIVMGDMNDEPSNKSLLQVLNAREPETNHEGLVNLMFPLHLEKQGSYNYRGNWNMLDNLVVSDNLLDKKGFRVINGKGEIYRSPWMEYTNRDGNISPNRTYGGPNYYGGVSDHFPVYLRLVR